MNEVGLKTRDSSGADTMATPVDMVIPAIEKQIKEKVLDLEFRLSMREDDPRVYWFLHQPGMRSGNFNVSYTWINSDARTPLKVTISYIQEQVSNFKAKQPFVVIRVSKIGDTAALKRLMAKMLLPLFDANPKPVPQVEKTEAELAAEAARAERARVARDELAKLQLGGRSAVTSKAPKAPTVFWTVPVGGTTDHLHGLDKHGINPHMPVWKSTDEETDPVRKAIQVALTAVSPFYFPIKFGVSRGIALRFLSHGFPLPSAQQIKGLSRIPGVTVDALKHYIWDHYLHDFNLDDLATRAGHPGALFDVEVPRDTALIKKFNENPGSLGEALWVAQKIKGMSLRRMSDTLDVSEKLLSRLRQLAVVSLVADQKTKLAGFLGLSLDDFDARWPQFIRVIKEKPVREPRAKIPPREPKAPRAPREPMPVKEAPSKLTYVEKAQRENFHLKNTQKYGINPRAPTWRELAAETDLVRHALLTLATTETNETAKEKGLPELFYIKRLLAHALPVPPVAYMNAMAQVANLDPLVIYRYIIENYAHELNVDDLARRHGDEQAVFYFDVISDAPRLRQFNENPGTLAEALWYAQKKHHLTGTAAANKAGLGTVRYSGILNGEPCEITKEYRLKVASWLGMSLEAFDARWPNFVKAENSLLYSSYTVEKGRDDKRHQEKADYYGIHPRAPQWYEVVDEVNPVRRALWNNLLNKSDAQIKAVGGAPREFMWRLLCHALPPPNIKLIERLAKSADLPSHDIYRYVEENYFHELNIRAVAERQGQVETFFYIDWMVDVSLAKGFHATPHSIGEALWFKRKTQGFSVQKAAVKARMQQDTWRALEQGKTEGVSPAQFYSLSKYLNISVDDFRKKWPHLTIEEPVATVDEGIKVDKRRRYTVETGKAERRFELATKAYGISPLEPDWDGENHLRQVLFDILNTKSIHEIKASGGPERSQLWDFLCHALPPPTDVAIKKMAELTGIAVDEFYRYLFEQYFGELKIGDIAKRQGMPDAVFFIDVLQDAPLIRSYQENPDTLGEALWFVRKIKGLYISNVAASLGIDHTRLSKIEKNTIGSILPEDRERLAQFLGLTQDAFNQKYPFTTSTVRRAYTVDLAQRDARYLVDNDKYGFTPKAPEWPLRGTDRDPVRRKLRDQLHKYNGATLGLDKDIIWDFLCHALPPPGRKNLERLANAAGVKVDDVYRYMFDNFYHELKLSELTARNGKPDAVFYINPNIAPALVRSYNQSPGTLGEKLWFSRKVRGLKVEQAAPVLNISVERLRNLERNADKGLLPRDIPHIAAFTGVDEKDLIPYLQGADKISLEIDETVTREKIPYLVARALGEDTHKVAAQKMTAWREKLTGNTQPIPFTALMGLTAYDRIDVRHTTKEDLAAFALAYGDRLTETERAGIWHAYFESDLEGLYNKRNKVPTLVLPDNLTISSLFNFSIPQELTRYLYGQGLSYRQAAKDLSSAPDQLRAYAVQHASIESKDKMRMVAQATGLSPSLVYLLLNPWALFFMPVLNEAGERLNPFTVDDKEPLVEKVRQYFDGQRNTHRFLDAELAKMATRLELVQNKGENKMSFLTRTLEIAGVPEKYRRAMVHPYGLLDDEGLLYAAENFIEIDKQQLLESHRYGELSLMLGMNDKGAIDYPIYTVVPHLNAIKTYIESAGFSEAKKPTPAEIYRLCQNGGSHLSMRDVYWHYYGDFIRQFVGGPKEPVVATTPAPAPQKPKRPARIKAAATVVSGALLAFSPLLQENMALAVEPIVDSAAQMIVADAATRGELIQSDDTHLVTAPFYQAPQNPLSLVENAFPIVAGLSSWGQVGSVFSLASPNLVLFQR